MYWTNGPGPKGIDVSSFKGVCIENQGPEFFLELRPSKCWSGAADMWPQTPSIATGSKKFIPFTDFKPKSGTAMPCGLSSIDDVVKDLRILMFAEMQSGKQDVKVSFCNGDNPNPPSPQPPTPG